MNDRAMPLIRLLAFIALTGTTIFAIARGESLQAAAVFIASAIAWLRTLR